MHISIPIILLSAIASATYTVQDDYTPSKFASMFDFYTDADPTDGYVNYVDQNTAQNDGLLKVQNNSVYMGVDNTNVASGRGRESVRISSKNNYTHGLFVLDLAHMPGGQCGSWPAFWLLGPNWPNSGELDIIEGVNTQGANSMALHTDSGCSITNSGQFSGELEYSNCDVSATNQPSNVGCSIASQNNQSYGTGFNSAGGGVYATQWTSEKISIWFFPRSAIPQDITSGNPNPDNWGLAMASFSGACNLDDHVFNQQIVFDITFCGQWAGEVWSQDTTCAAKASTCQGFVQNNPTAFKETYWQINSLRVYQESGSSSASTTSIQTATSTAISSATTSIVLTTTSTMSTVYMSTVPVVSTANKTSTTTSASATSVVSTTASTTSLIYSVVTTSAAPTTTSTVSSVIPISTVSLLPTTMSTIISTSYVSTTILSSTTPKPSVSTTPSSTALATSAVSSGSWSNWGSGSHSGDQSGGHSGGYGGGSSWGQWGGGGRRT